MTIRHAFTAGFVLLLLSCAGSPTKDSEVCIIPNVPFFPQDAYQCGPSSLAGVLNYWGIKVLPEEIAHEIYSATAKGTLDLDMVSYAEGKNLQAKQYKGSWDDLRQNIDRGCPVIVLVDYGLLVYHVHHYINIIGYNDRGVIGHSGNNRNQFIPYPDLIRAWQKTAFWTLLITPEK